jgi:hypothetical protein
MSQSQPVKIRTRTRVTLLVGALLAITGALGVLVGFPDGVKIPPMALIIPGVALQFIGANMAKTDRGQQPPA